ARHTSDVCLAAKHAFGADFAGHARDFGGERAKLIDHGVDRVLELEDLALDVHGDLFRQVAARHRLGDVGDVAHLTGQVARHRVDAFGQVLPRPGHTLHVGLTAQFALGPDLARHARDFGGERAELIDHGVDRVLELEDLALDVDGDLLRQVAGRDRRRDVRDVAHLRGQVARHRVDTF